jgi:hypothetical protein
MSSAPPTGASSPAAAAAAAAAAANNPNAGKKAVHVKVSKVLRRTNCDRKVRLGFDL